jgi:hypothetical protein
VTWAEYRGFSSWQRQEILSSPKHPGQIFDPSGPSVQWAPEALSHSVKEPGHKANHSAPSSGIVKNEWSCTSSPPICLYGMYRSSFTHFILNKPQESYDEKSLAESVTKS